MTTTQKTNSVEETVIEPEPSDQERRVDFIVTELNGDGIITCDGSPSRGKTVPGGRFVLYMHDGKVRQFTGDLAASLGVTRQEYGSVAEIIVPGGVNRAISAVYAEQIRMDPCRYA
jgi:hypothetical protein